MGANGLLVIVILIDSNSFSYPHSVGFEIKSTKVDVGLVLDKGLIMPKEEHYKKLASLAPRQKEVLKLLCQGKKYKEIAKKLFITKSTVKAHMAKVYEKLGLIGLNRDDRIFQIKSIYCPMLQEEENPEIIDVPYEEIHDESEPEELTPEMDKMVSSDEKAIIKFEGEKISVPSRPKEKKVRLSGIRRFFRTVLVLIILVIFVGGGLYIWQNFFNGPEVLPSEIIQKEYYDVGEWVKQGDVWSRIKEYDIDTIGHVDILIEIWNKTPNDLLFSYNPGISFMMTDNTGHSYKLSGPFEISAMDNQIIDSQDVENIRFKATAETVAFYDQAIFSADVTELYLTMNEFSVFNDVKFIIPIR